ncbi:uncharacterized protein LY89DRAFT_510702 [Mollisia scopiformis]|uniref:Uncharacterized protein n=1 Tax=Mollisia scopiformis TaxID=149040 RepID=A0A194XFP6_MOLSC|nr:uncharacterized protein LY89DRAFT_510702 [Mollisia scopiformis]KUJ19020.1 hypothetical protein LY89DRAFT_510702 [Mollisia scopiformis]
MSTLLGDYQLDLAMSRRYRSFFFLPFRLNRVRIRTRRHETLLTTSKMQGKKPVQRLIEEESTTHKRIVRWSFCCSQRIGLSCEQVPYPPPSPCRDGNCFVHNAYTLLGIAQLEDDKESIDELSSLHVCTCSISRERLFRQSVAAHFALKF